MALLSGFDQIDPANDSFSDWLTKTNEMLLIIRGNTTPGTTQAMTANSLPGGSMTWGNATLFGQLTANTMVVLNNGGNDGSDDNVFANGNFGGLRGGDWNPATNTITADTLYIVSNTTYTDESVEVYVDSTYGLIVEQNIEARHDVLFVGNGGSNTNPKMHWEDADNILSFNDDVRAVFGKDSGSEVVGGTGQMELFFTGGRMYANTENLNIRANTDVNFITDNFELKSDVGSELYISADVADNSTVKLYYEGNERLATNTHGVVVTGDAIVQDDLVMFDGGRIMMGNTYPYDGTQNIASYNFQIYTDGTDGIIVSGDKDLNVFVHEGFNLTNEPGTVNFITANNDGSSEVVLYNNGTARLETTGSQVGEVPGVEIFGEANTTTLRVLTDANFDGFGGLDSNNVHWDASANTWNYRDATKITLGDSDDWEMFYLTAGRAYSNTDNMDIRARTDMNMISDTFELKSETGAELYMSANVADNSTVRLYYEGVERLQTNTNGVEVTGELVANGGIVTYNNQPIEMGGADYAAAHNFTIVTDGTDTTITETTNDLSIRVEDNFRVTDDTGSTSLIVANTAGEVTLYHNNNQKMQTNAYGIEVTGEANTDTLRVNGNVHIDGSTDGITPTLNANNIQWVSLSNTMNFDDNTYLEFGTSGDFKIHHDSMHTYMQDTAGVGNVYLDTNAFIVRNAAGDENLIRASQDTSVALYYNNNIKIETTNIGVDIEGEANTDTLRVQSNAQFEDTLGNINLEWVAASKVLDFADGARARFGDGNDLQIWHSGTNSFIADSGTGNLNISATNLVIEAQDGTDYITAVDGDSVKIFYAGDGANNIARVTTTNIGVDLQGEANTDTLRVQGDGQFESDAVTANEAALTWSASARVLNFNTNAKATFGTAGELQVYYSDAGNNSIISETGTGNLVIDATNLILRASDNSRYLEGIDGSHVRIYSPDDSVALTANNNQVHISDLANTNTLRVRSTSLFENDISIEGSTSGEALSWDKTANTLNFNDNNFATFGTSGDLAIHHNASDSFIVNGTGDFVLRNTANDKDVLISSDDGANGVTDYIRADGSTGEVLLYFYGTQKLETNAGGITVTGNTVADGFVAGDNEKLQLGAAQDLELYHNATDSFVENSTGDLVIQNNANNSDIVIKSDDSAGGLADYVRADGSTGEVVLSHYGSQKLQTKADGVWIEGTANTDILRVQGTALLEESVFFDGTDPANSAISAADQLVWEHDNNILQWKDGVKATFGDSDDLEIYHDGFHSYIRDQGTGRLYATSSNFRVTNAAGDEIMIDAVEDGAVSLYHNAVSKFTTSATGATLTGTLVADGVTVGDNEIIQLGTTMQLYNDGSNSYITETGGGDLNIQSNNLIIETTTGENIIQGVAGGAVTLYENGAARLDTTATGVDVTGSLDVSLNLTVTGSTTLNGNIDLGSDTDDTITFNGYVDSNIIPNANTTLDLGTAELVWNDIYSGGVISGANGAFSGDLTVSGNTAVTGNTSASHFIGNGSQLTDLNGSSISTGTVAAARIDAELTSNTSGIAAKSDDIAVTAIATDAAFPIVFTDASGAYRNAYDDASFTYNPSDDTLIVPNLTVTTQINLPTTVEIATGNFTDISVSNTATILNLEVTSLEANGVAFTGTGGDVTTTAATIIDSFPITQTRGYKYFVHGEVTNDDTKGYAVEINVITTDTGADTKIFYTRYGEVESGMADVVIVPQKSASNNTHIDLMATCDSATGTAIHRFNVLKIETRDNGV